MPTRRTLLGMTSQGSHPPRWKPARHPVRRFLIVSMAAGVVLAGMLLPAAGGVALGARDAAQSFESLPSVRDNGVIGSTKRVADAAKCKM